MGSNCNVVSRWPKCNHVPEDALGINGLQVTESGLERSGFPGNDAVSVGQAFQYVGQNSLQVQGTRSPKNIQDVIFPKPEYSLRK